MNKIFSLSLFIFLSVLFVHSSYSQIEVFTANDTNITVTAGEQFTISLESNPTTGYNWSVRIPEGGEKIMIISSEYAKSKSGKIGEGGEQLWRFKTIGTGEVKLELSYIRPWKKKEPSKTLMFNVKVE